MSKLKLGVFGDSFADVNPQERYNADLNIYPWSIHLTMELGTELTSYASSATSLWWAYKRFLQYYDEFDVIVFVYTEYNRWNTVGAHDDTNANLAALVDEYRLDILTSSEEQKKIGKLLLEVRPYIFDEEFNRFTYQNIFDSVNKLCKISGKKLINIMPFDGFDDNRGGGELPVEVTARSGPLLTSLAKISYNEIDNAPKFMKIVRSSMDERHCHINPHNNRVLAKIIKEHINSLDIVNLPNDDRFSYDPEHLKYITG